VPPDTSIPRFLCDTNVARLAKYLRFAGFDTVIRRELSLQKLQTLCEQEKRVFITRSTKKDTKYFKKKIVIISNEIGEQIAQFLQIYHIRTDIIATRCIVCNAKLKEAAFALGKSSTTFSDINVSQIPKPIKYCQSCGRYYWRGTHYDKMLKMFEIRYSTSP
jgi:hypothetical protein